MVGQSVYVLSADREGALSYGYGQAVRRLREVAAMPRGADGLSTPESQAAHVEASERLRRIVKAMSKHARREAELRYGKPPGRFKA